MLQLGMARLEISGKYLGDGLLSHWAVVSELEHLWATGYLQLPEAPSMPTTNRATRSSRDSFMYLFIYLFICATHNGHTQPIYSECWLF